MKSIANQKTLATIILLGSTTNLMAADSSNGLQITDTMIFSLFVIMALVFMMIIYAQTNALKGILENKDLWLNKDSSNGNAKKASVVVAAIALSQGLYAQGGDSESLVVMTNELYWIMIGLNTFLLGIILTLYYVIKGMIRSLKGEEEEAVDTISQFTATLTDAIPIERESEILLDHNYDGIHELDNNLPPWWKYGFYITIVFAFIYLIRFHVTQTGDLQIAEYDKEMQQAEIEMAAFMETQANLVDESNLMALEDGARLEAGKKVYLDNCKICHGEKGEGLVGPNLTDEYWKHGGGISNVYNTIKIGVPSMGMIPWEGQLTPGQIHEVSSYILTLEGTNPPNAKAPEGDIWKAEAVPAPAEPASEELEIIEESGDQSNTDEGEKA